MRTEGCVQRKDSLKCNELFYSLLFTFCLQNSNFKISFDGVPLFQRGDNITKPRLVTSKGFGIRKKRPLESVLSLTSCVTLVSFLTSLSLNFFIYKSGSITVFISLACEEYMQQCI